MVKIYLKKTHNDRVKDGHPWIFSNEINKMPDKVEPGAEAEIYTSDGKFIGKGYFNPHSLISARILSREKVEFDLNFFIERFERASKYRQKIYPNETAYRVVFGESDGLAGLVIDRYNDYYVVQIFSAGIEKRIEVILSAMKKVFKPKAIIEKSESSMREMEGLERRTGLIYGEIEDPIILEQDELKFKVSLLEGQKTGFFFDQRDNRKALERYVKGKTILDCFSYVGTFAMYALKYGAKEVISIDSSESALQFANENAKLNGFSDRFSTIKADIFEKLDEFVKEVKKFDVVILDPPALAKNKSRLKEALHAYEMLNEMALKLLNNGGILHTSSCSYNVSKDKFKEVLIDASTRAGREIWLLEYRTQALDHPVMLSCRETEYLKCAILQII